VENPNEVQDYISKFVANKFDQRKRILKYTKRALKIITAVLSIWIPGLVKAFQASGQEEAREYTEIIFGQISQLCQVDEKQSKVAEMTITKEMKTNGLVEDLEIIIQLFIDQTTLHMKVITKKGY
jgi:hypothetical protein